jgi:hypothetical protein
LSSATDLRSGLTGTGLSQPAFGPTREATNNCGLPVRHGVVRMKEKYCRPRESIATPGSDAHVFTKLAGAGYRNELVHDTPPSVEE